MKGNPFIKEIISASELAGRKKEIYEITGALDNAIAHRNMLVEVAGPAGIGKTMFLKRVQELAKKSKCLSVYIRVQRKEKKEGIMKKMLEEMLESSLDAIAEKSIHLRVDRFLRDHEEELRKKFEKCQISTNDLASEIALIYGKIRESIRAFVFLLDDVDKGLKIEEIYNEIEELSKKLKASNIPSMFVLSTSYSTPANESYRRILLEPLTEHDMRELIEKLLKPTKIKIGEECMKELLAECEGNPTILLTVCWVLFDKLREKEKLITKGHYLASRSAMINILGSDIFDEIYQLTSPAEKELLKLIAREGTIRVSLIAKKMKKPLNVITRLVLRLVESGNLVRPKRGEYRIFNRLYGKYVLKQID